MDIKPKYTILIPTRNGAAYVIYAVQSVLCQSYQSVEVVVSVNHSEDDTLSRLSTISDSRLTVISPPELLSMTKHYEWCLKQANGDWVTILGDDDAVMPFFFKEVDALIQNSKFSNIDAISFRRADYYWPGLDTQSVIRFIANREQRKVSGKRQLIGALIGINEHYELPELYTNNIIHSKLIKQITKESNETFYNELTPDVYSGVVIALNCKNMIRSEVPVFWTGSSPKSTGNTNKRILEHIMLAEKDAIGIATEIGINLSLAAQTSSIYVLSALFKYPNLNKHFSKRLFRVLTCIGFAETTIKAYQGKTKDKYNIVNKAMSKQLEQLGISRFWLLLSFIPIIFDRLVLFCKRGFRFLARKAGIIKGDNYSFISLSHQDFPDIMLASNKINELYDLNNSFSINKNKFL